MRIEAGVLAKTIADSIAALDGDMLELAARVADVEAERLDSAADHETDAALSKELRAGARAARRVGIGIRALKTGA